MGVAEYAVRYAPLQGFYHRRRRGEIAVGDPKREDVAAAIFISLNAVTVTAVYPLIKIECHSYNPEPVYAYA